MITARTADNVSDAIVSVTAVAVERAPRYVVTPVPTNVAPRTIVVISNPQRAACAETFTAIAVDRRLFRRESLLRVDVVRRDGEHRFEQLPRFRRAPHFQKRPSKTRLMIKVRRVVGGQTTVRRDGVGGVGIPVVRDADRH